MTMAAVKILDKRQCQRESPASFILIQKHRMADPSGVSHGYQSLFQLFISRYISKTHIAINVSSADSEWSGLFPAAVPSGLLAVPFLFTGRAYVWQENRYDAEQRQEGAYPENKFDACPVRKPSEEGGPDTSQSEHQPE